MMDKQKLRKEYRAVRLAMEPQEVTANSKAICEKLFSEIVASKPQKIHTYNPLGHLNEVGLEYLFNRLVEYKAERPEVAVTVGKKNKNSPAPSQKFDLIIVPCLAFDKQNHRLGWGGGWYDRFLAAQPRAHKIGVCFGNGFVKNGLPHETHDIPLDKILTEV